MWAASQGCSRWWQPTQPSPPFHPAHSNFALTPRCSTDGVHARALGINSCGGKGCDYYSKKTIPGRGIKSFKTTEQITQILDATHMEHVLQQVLERFILQVLELGLQGEPQEPMLLFRLRR